MDEQAVRNQAALSELKAINDLLTQRCVLLAAELAVKSPTSARTAYPGVTPMATNEDLMHAIQSMDAKLEKHITDEEPVLDNAKMLIASHGTDEMIRARINFVNGWMKREEARQTMRRKIAESATIWAVIIVMGFIAVAVATEVREVIKGWHDSGFMGHAK